MQETLIIVFIGQASIVVGKIVFDWLRDRRNGSNGRMAEDIRWLRQQHSKTDEDGTPIWYFPRSVEKNIGKMAKHLENIERDLKK